MEIILGSTISVPDTCSESSEPGTSKKIPSSRRAGLGRDFVSLSGMMGLGGLKKPLRECNYGIGESQEDLTRYIRFFPKKYRLRDRPPAATILVRKRGVVFYWGTNGRGSESSVFILTVAGFNPSENALSEISPARRPACMITWHLP